MDCDWDSTFDIILSSLNVMPPPNMRTAVKQLALAVRRKESLVAPAVAEVLATRAARRLAKAFRVVEEDVRTGCVLLPEKAPGVRISQWEIPSHLFALVLKDAVGKGYGWMPDCFVGILDSGSDTHVVFSEKFSTEDTTKDSAFEFSACVRIDGCKFPCRRWKEARVILSVRVNTNVRRWKAFGRLVTCHGLFWALQSAKDKHLPREFVWHRLGLNPADNLETRLRDAVSDLLVFVRKKGLRQPLVGLTLPLDTSAVELVLTALGFSESHRSRALADWNEKEGDANPVLFSLPVTASQEASLTMRPSRIDTRWEIIHRAVEDSEEAEAIVLTGELLGTQEPSAPSEIKGPPPSPRRNLVEQVIACAGKLDRSDHVWKRVADLAGKLGEVS